MGNFSSGVTSTPRPRPCLPTWLSWMGAGTTFFFNTTFCTGLEATAFLSGMLRDPGSITGRALEVAAPSMP